MRRTLFAYAWDIAESGAQAFADEARRLGMTDAAVAVSYHAGKFLRPKGTSGKVFYPEDGTVYFEPDLASYGRLKPVPVSDLPTRRAVSDLAATGLPVEGWTVLLHNSRLGIENPDLIARNAFGDGLRFSLCPANDAVAEYAVALSADAARQPVTGLTLETPGWLPQVHGDHHEFQQVRNQPWLDGMLSLCFCDTCVTKASDTGIDAKALKRWVATSVDNFLNGPADPDPGMAGAWWMAELATRPELASFIRWRCFTVSTLVKRIRAVMPADKSLSVIPSVARPTAGAWAEGSDLAALSKGADSLSICAYEPTAGRVIADAVDTIARIGGTERLRVILRPGHPDLSIGETAAALKGLQALGLDDIGFYNHGHLRRADLDALGALLTGETA
ncbi:hypothetical protein ACFSM5_03145 [Lacibacterium aquatile]|uniref:Alanine-rich protein n=1 Tax=Lacibacterium aquatile TaxID=1168082 RepID=A0ABW5DL59_9PROT